jgi:Heat induced stress protein YflT domain
MPQVNSVVAIYDTHSQAEAAVKDLQRSGFDMKKLSIVGKDYHTDEHVVGGDRTPRSATARRRRPRWKVVSSVRWQVR